jgi:hypothetical protein
MRSLDAIFGTAPRGSNTLRDSRRESPPSATGSGPRSRLSDSRSSNVGGSIKQVSAGPFRARRTLFSGESRKRSHTFRVVVWMCGEPRSGTKSDLHRLRRRGGIRIQTSPRCPSGPAGGHRLTDNASCRKMSRNMRNSARGRFYGSRGRWCGRLAPARCGDNRPIRIPLKKRGWPSAASIHLPVSEAPRRLVPRRPGRHASAHYGQALERRSGGNGTRKPLLPLLPLRETILFPYSGRETAGVCSVAPRSPRLRVRRSFSWNTATSPRNRPATG